VSAYNGHGNYKILPLRHDGNSQANAIGHMLDDLAKTGLRILYIVPVNTKFQVVFFQNN